MVFSISPLPNTVWETLFDTSNVWKLIVSNKDEITYTSKNCENFIGVTADEIVKNPRLIWHAIDRNHRKKVKKFSTKRKNNNTDILNIEFKIHTPDGSEKWLSSDSQPVFSPEGIHIGYRLNIRDITELMKEKLCLKKLIKQQNVLVLVTQIAASTDPFNTRIESILKIIGNYTGVSRVYIFENSNDGKVTSNTYEWCRKGITSQKNNLQNISYSIIPSWVKILSKKGIIMTSDIKTLPADIYNVLNPQGIKSILVIPLNFQDHQLGFIGFDECKRQRIWENDEINLLKTVCNTITNVFYRNTYEKELEQAKNNLQNLLNRKISELHRSENYFKALIETQQDLICRWLPDTTLTYVNDAYCKFFNVKDEEIIGRKWIDFIESDSRSHIEPIIKNIFKTGNPATYEHTAINFKGEVRWHQWIDTPLKNQDGVITELQSTGRDVTDKINYETGLTKAKEKMEELDRTKLEFLRLVSHELRTPLNAILGFSELIKTTTDIELISTFSSYIYESGKTLFKMIEDMLTLTNLQSGNTPVTFEEIELLPLLKELYEKFDNNLIKLEKPVSLKLKHYIKPGFKIIVDKGKLEFILTKLLDNALVFCDKGLIQFGSRIKKDNILFYVKDEGIGISEENQKNIFQDFKKINSQNRSFHEGLGVSLYISKELVELMGGHIWVDSKINIGSTFYFTLPLQKGERNITYSILKEIAIPEEDKIIPDLKGRKILVVDDTESNLKYLVEAIKETKASILWARNGAECLNIFRSNRDIDCVLMDILMPEMDGYEACLQIRKLNDEVPIIAQTAYGLDDEVKMVIDSNNFTDYLIKPVWKHELFRKLKKHLLKSQPVNYNERR